jgi:hypothetical protein
MGKLASLKIDDCPYAFASFAAKHNALVELLGSMVGENGISVVMAEKNAIIRGNIAGGAAGNVTIDNVSTANVVGFNGLLQNAYVGNVIANAWPTTLRTVNAGANVEMSNNGLFVEVVSLPGSTVVWQVNTGTYTLQVLADGKFKVNGTNSLVLDPASLAGSSMSIKEIDVCDGGVAKKMLVVASDPY